MSGLSRRIFLSSLGAAAGLGTFQCWFLNAATPAGGQQRIRFEASSPNGLAMLDVFRQAARQMQETATLPWHHPLSWRYQVNIHLYPLDEPIDTQIFNLSGGPGDAEIKEHRRRALGTDVAGQFSGGVWATCPHHDPNQYFLPWHRLYLTYFEQIVEKFAGKPFSLPYWDYLDPKTRSLPSALGPETINGQPNPLYFPFRNPQFLREGLDERILDIFSKPGIDWLFGQPLFFTSPQGNGFSRELEGTLHDIVHSAVGLREGMATPEFAARDPIFWLHHANIDRIWESWRLARQDGTSERDPPPFSPWRTVRFQFIEMNGNEASADISQSLQAAANLGYRYDMLENVPPLPALPSLEQVGLRSPARLWESAGTQKSIRTPEDIISIPLVPVQMQGVISELTRNPHVRYELSIDLNTESEPGIYEVFLKSENPSSASGTEDKIGSFSLFAPRSDHHHEHGTALRKVDTTIRIDITKQVKAKVVDPNKIGEIVIRPSYLSETVDVVVKRISISAK
jgi:tyrosinase